MIKLHLDSDSLEKSSLGSITGIIYLTINDEPYPEVNWNDFVVVVLGSWIVEILRMKQGDTSGMFLFMDGPIRFSIETKANISKLNYFVQDKMISHHIIDFEMFADSITTISSELLETIHTKKWTSIDVDFLADKLYLLKTFNQRFGFIG